MKLKMMPVLLIVAGMASAAEADLSQVVQAERWQTIECSAKGFEFEGKPALQIDFPIDHKKGEPKYLIGWPRAFFTTRTTEADWSGAKKLEIKVRPDFTGTTQKILVVFQFFHEDAEPKRTKFIFPLQNGRTQIVTIDLAKLPSRNIERIGLVVRESDYKHGEDLKLTVIGYKLLK